MKHMQSLLRLMSGTLAAIVMFSLLQAGPAYAQMNVVEGTGQIGDGVTLDIQSNGQWQVYTFGTERRDGRGWTNGGEIHSPSGGPDLWFRAASTPDFPGTLDNYVEWSIGDFGENNFGGGPIPWEGAVDGTDNWMKVIRDSDGCVSWAQFTFDFGWYAAAGHITGDPQPILTDIPLYVTRTDCADFTLAEALNAVSAVSAEAMTFGNLKSLYR